MRMIADPSRCCRPAFGALCKAICRAEIRPAPRHNSGFTLVELLITIVVMGIALSSLSVGLLNASRHAADPVVALRAVQLGQAYLEEILAKRFDENTGSGGVTRCDESGQPACSASFGADSGEARSSFDDVDDYDGLNEAPADALGNARAQYSGYNVSIAVAFAGTEVGITDRAAKRITVTVKSPLQDEFVFAAYRGNF